MTSCKNGAEMVETEQQTGWQAGRQAVVGGSRDSSYHLATFKSSGGRAGPKRGGATATRQILLAVSVRPVVDWHRRHWFMSASLKTSGRDFCASDLYVKSQGDFDFFSTSANSRVTAEPRAELK